MYYFKGKTRTIENVREQANPNERKLLSNMESHHFNQIIEIETEDYHKYTYPLYDNDVVFNL